MVNKEEFSKRLEKMLNFYEISAATLADKIGIQRSSISHLLSGRNKPSLDFVIKVLDNYPEINFDWFVKGIGNIFSELSVENTKDATPTLFENIDDNTDKESFIKESSKFIKNIPAKKSIEKILVLYTDGSFESYLA